MKKNALYGLVSLLPMVMLLMACQRYYANNMLGEGNIDVTRYVELGYKPIYCTEDNKICKLINPNPIPISNEDIVDIRLFLVRAGIELSMENSELRKDLRYKNTYFITWYPVDCFELNVRSSTKKYRLEIRKEYNNKNSDDRLILPDTSYSDTRFMIVD